MAKYRVTYAIFVLVCLIFSAAYQSRVTTIMLAVSLAYPLAAFVCTALSLFMLKIEFDQKRAVYEKKEQFELPVQIRNNFLFPYAPAELDCIIPDVETGLFLRKQIYASVSPLKHMRIFIPCMHCYRGAYEATIRKLSVYDPLRIIRLSRRMDERTQLVFLPRKIALDKLAQVFGGERAALAEQRMTGDKDIFSHVREYAWGDVVQQVHWKLTAKLDELMIKQYDAEGDRRAVILCNFGRYNATPSAVMRNYDAVVETAVSVAMSAINSGVKAYADTGAVTELTCDIADSAGFNRFFDMMSVIPPNLNVLEFPALIDKYASGGAATMFMITAVLDEGILAAAQRAAECTKGAVVLMYINFTGVSAAVEDTDERRYLFAEICGETADGLSVVAEQILAEYTRLNS